MIGMAARKVTVSLDAGALQFAQRAAELAGLSTSAWLSRAAREHAIRTHPPGNEPDAEAAAAYETELLVAEEDQRATG